MISLYHYTSKENAEKIEKSGFIKQSLMKDGDAILGDGVYFTGIAPGEKSKFKIVENNWDDQNLSIEDFLKIVMQGKIEYVIKVSISSTLNVQIFRTNVVSAAFLQLDVSSKSCQNDVRTKNSYV